MVSYTDCVHTIIQSTLLKADNVCSNNIISPTFKPNVHIQYISVISVFKLFYTNEYNLMQLLIIIS